VTAIQVIALLLVAIAGPAVVLTRDPLRQVPVNGIFGLLLALLFFVFQAPDVALSEIVVGSIAVPAMVLLAIGRVRRREQADRG
jgi:uncharacterized MnhB-related membrane protein